MKLVDIELTRAKLRAAITLIQDAQALLLKDSPHATGIDGVIAAAGLHVGNCYGHTQSAEIQCSKALMYIEFVEPK